MGRTTELHRVVLYTVTVIMASFGMTSVASAQSVITNTGPNSSNSITSDTNNTCTVENTNNVSASNQTSQDAVTGSTTSADNQSAGLSWAGWNALDPVSAQTAGTSYKAWRGEITDWIAARASGTGWTSTGNNVAWAPSDSNWSSFEPMLWQTNGQTFSNWLNATESYLNSNSTDWILSWPADATSGIFGSSVATGQAANNNNSNFSISINNAAIPTNGCSRTSMGSGGMGGGPGSSPVGSMTAGGVQGLSANSSKAPVFTAGSNNGGQGQQQGNGQAFATGTRIGNGNVAQQNQGTTSNPSSGLGGASNTAAPSGTSSAGAGASISNTGPGSTNIVSSDTTQTTTVNNCNTVNVANTSTQTATSGSSTAVDNGNGGSASGSASNNNGAGLSTDVNS